MATISLSGVKKSFGKTDVIHGVDVDIADGELGVWKHQRAVKLKSPIDPAFVQEVSAA